MPVSPILERQTTYPFVRLNEAAQTRRGARRRGDRLRHGRSARADGPRIRQALVDGLRDRMGYPRGGRACPSSERRSRRGRRGGSARRSTRTPRSSRRSAARRRSSASRSRSSTPSGARDTVAYTEPGYPVYERGALFAHARPLALPLREEHGFLPDLDAIDEETWARLAVFWVNYPNNPTGATAPLSLLRASSPALAREHGFVLASDEAYTELWFDEPPASALQLADRTNVVVFNTLSKRSSMTGLPVRVRRRRPGA